MLSPYRVLDATDERGEVAGMVLRDLGADVIRVEPPEGTPSRHAEPLWRDGSGPARSLQFEAYNGGKRSIALDLSHAPDRETFGELAAGSDFVLESFPSGALAGHGWDFEALRARNPRIVHVQISPFGVDGPYAGHAASDLTLAAMGGPMALQGVAERAPLRLSIPQVWRHTGVEAALAALVAHARMLQTGEAQQVDVSAQCAMTWTLLNAMVASAIQGHDFERGGSLLQLGNVTIPLVFACRDGHLVALGWGATVVQLLPWMTEDGIADADWAAEDWTTYDVRAKNGEPLRVGFERFFRGLCEFFQRHTKDELFWRGLREDVTLAPVNTLEDLLGFRQLLERNFFSELELPGGRVARAPGAFARPSAVPLRPRRPAPATDQHGSEIRRELAAGTRELSTQAPLGGGLPFSGLKVADFTWIGVGPISSRCLADHGATVVKMESEIRADGLRAAGPFKDGVVGWNRSQFFGDFNTSKLSLKLDLKNPAALDVAKRVVAWADVVMESYTPGAIARLGLGYEVVREINPSAIMLSTCLMGQTGPAAGMAGYGYHAGAVAGFYDLTGWPDLPPDGPWQAYTDTIAPRFVISTLLAAIDHRRRTGEGQYIDAAQMEMALHFLAPELLEHQLAGSSPSRRGNRARSAAPHSAYPCAGEDQWCAIAVETEDQWRNLRRALGDPEWARAADLQEASGRLARESELDARLAEWTREQDRYEVMRHLQRFGVPAGVVQRSSDLLRDPQLRHRGFHRSYEHAEMGRIPYSGHQYRIRGYDSGPRSPAPLLGEHSFEVLQKILGMDDEEIARLVATGAVG